MVYDSDSTHLCSPEINFSSRDSHVDRHINIIQYSEIKAHMCALGTKSRLNV